MKPLNWILPGLLTFTIGCGSSSVTPPTESAATAPPDSRYVAASEPVDAVPVGEARKSVENEDMVTLVGTIGGSTAPFVDGIAAFTIVDPKVPYCAAEEGCPTPWDYCCTQDQVKDNIATVKIVDDAGSPLNDDARELLGVQELSTVVVQGQAKRDEQGNLTVAATKVFVRPSE
ncbi:MAG: hypothetical protein ACR2NZ_00775 [Rubripirellula sp.]